MAGLKLTETGISGWAVNNASPWERVEVQLFIDGKFVASAIADQPGRMFRRQVGRKTNGTATTFACRDKAGTTTRRAFTCCTTAAAANVNHCSLSVSAYFFC